MSANDPKGAKTAEVGEEAMPLPVDAKVVYLGGIFFILLLAALYETAEIVWPLVFAFMLSLLLQPPMRLLERLRIPRALCALLLVVGVLGLVVGLGTAISGPAASWAAKLPEGLPRLFQRLSFLEAPLATLQSFWQQIENFAGWQESANSSAGSTLLTKLFTGTRSFASGFFTTLLFLFFLLVAGDIFLQRLVEIMPRFGGKRQVVDIAKQIESDISARFPPLHS